MYKLKINDTVIFTENGTEYSGIIVEIGKKKAAVLVSETKEERRIPIKQIKYVPPITPTYEQIRMLCRYEIKLSELKAGSPDCAEVLFDECYEITLEDLLVAMENIKLSKDDDDKILDEWFFPIFYGMWIESEKTPDNVEMIEGLPTRQDSIKYILSDLIDEFFEDEFQPIQFYEMADNIIEYINSIFDNEQKPILERSYTDEEKERVVKIFDNDDKLRTANERELSVYRAFVDFLCQKDNIKALNAKGYGCYGGNPAYECDWDTSLECILKLFDLTGDPMYANTLGYIYYYGRCWNGEPKYEEAFKFFSIGAAGLYYESKYKLADMFANGYGVPKNTQLAYTMVQSLYNENIRYMIEGRFECKFADIALRLGKYTEKGYSESKNYSMAYYCYLQADFAIKQRLKYEYYGDYSVADSIRKSINSLLKSGNISEPQKTAKVNLNSFLYPYLKKYRKLQVKFKIQKNRKIKLSIRIAPFKDEQYPPKLFITSISTGFCGMIENLDIEVKHGQIVGFENANINKPVYFDDIDSISYDGKDGIAFLIGDVKIGVLIGTCYFSPTANNQDKKYRLASVYFTPGGKHYDYFLDIDNVSVGDKVLVMTNRGKTEVTVVAIFDKTESELALPIDRYKRILEKV